MAGCLCCLTGDYEPLRGDECYCGHPRLAHHGQKPLPTRPPQGFPGAETGFCVAQVPGFEGAR